MSPVLESTSHSQTDEGCSESCPAEETEPDPLLGSQEETQLKQIETTNVNIPSERGNSNEAGCAGLLSRLKAGACYWGVLSVVLNLLLLIIIIPIAHSAKKCELCPANPACPVAACPDGWIGYLRKCYYFSKAEANWTSSQSNCSAFGASLAGIDTQQEMDFVMHNKDNSGYWFGLHREPEQPWKWTNGTEFNHWFAVAGEEKCALMNHDITSSRCSSEERWICRK